jgi:hypothetical protein
VLALATFQDCDLDALCIGGYLAEKTCREIIAR